METENTKKSDDLGIPEVDHEARGARYFKEQYEKLNEKYNSVARYTGIISRLETDASLVDVLEKHIAGESIETRNALFSDSYDDDGNDVSKSPVSKTGGLSLAEREEAARRQGEMEATRRIELNNFIKTLATRGVPEYLADKFVAWTNNPSGLTVEDLYAAFHNMENRSIAGEKATTESQDKKQEGPSGLPVAAIGGSTDRPDTKASIGNLDGVRYVANPNNPF